MKICYTVCTLNRYGQALALAKSICQFNPEYQYIVCLADELNNRISLEKFENLSIIPLSELPFNKKNELIDRYDLFELSCALKAYYGDYILEVYHPELLIYLDTDIRVYNKFSPIEKALSDHSILITPHFTTPIPNDGNFPIERGVLSSGLYNGGFLAFRNDEQSKSFFRWWKERLFDQGFNRVEQGMMVDQLWLDLVPLYFKSAAVFMHDGCNVAYWNLHERSLKKEELVYRVNNEDLIFFHFSGFKIDNPQNLSIHQNRYDIAGNPILKELTSGYYQSLLEHNFSYYSVIDSFYAKKKKKPNILRRIIIRSLNTLGYRLQKI